jgi:3-methylfumaryl-CoA hydratase
MEKKLLSSPLVFRYSSVTWNAHRIHYDADYARSEEGYPATVQNGGLTMQLLLDAALKRAPGRLAGFTARLARPLWVGDTVTLCGAAPADGKMTCWAADKGGSLCATMDLVFA